MANDNDKSLSSALNEMGESDKIAKSFEPVYKIINNVVVATKTIKDIEAQLIANESPKLNDLAKKIKTQQELIVALKATSEDGQKEIAEEKRLVDELNSERKAIKAQAEKAAEKRQSTESVQTVSNKQDIVTQKLQDSNIGEKSTQNEEQQRVIQEQSKANEEQHSDTLEILKRVVDTNIKENVNVNAKLEPSAFPEESTQSVTIKKLDTEEQQRVIQEQSKANEDSANIVAIKNQLVDKQNDGGLEIINLDEEENKLEQLLTEYENIKSKISKEAEQAATFRTKYESNFLTTEDKEYRLKQLASESADSFRNAERDYEYYVKNENGSEEQKAKATEEYETAKKSFEDISKLYADATRKRIKEERDGTLHDIELREEHQKNVARLLNNLERDADGHRIKGLNDYEKKELELQKKREAWATAKRDFDEKSLDALLKKDKEYQDKKIKELMDKEHYSKEDATKLVEEEAQQAEQESKSAKDKLFDAEGDLIVAEREEKRAKKQEEAKAEVENSINSRLDNFTKYQASVNARLQGSTEKYQLALLSIQGRLSFSPFVKQQDIVENIKKLSDEGIAYNLEQRAFLQTISDKIANTFNAADGTLLRLIRLQQADTTAARLGMEAMLTKYLNRMFEDTSYLSGAHDQVNNTLIDAFSQMSKDMAAEFEFTVQKWLGALGSLGISDTAVTNIAQGINYLATGDVASLSSSESLQTLMAMTTSKMSKSYSDILVEGLDVDTTNELLREMVEYLKELAESDNMVVKNQFAKIFGMSMSDLTAISNLTNSEIKQIAGYNTSYDSMLNETDLQLKLMPLRMSMSEMISNVTENFYDQLAYSIGVNPVLRIPWELNKMIDSETGGINIPFVNAMGFGLDLNTNLNALTNLGVVGLSTLAQIPKLLTSVATGGGLFLDDWGIRETTKRGRGLQTTTDGIVDDVSSSTTHKASSSSADQEEGTLSDAADKAEETNDIINKNHKQEHDFDELFTTLFLDDQKPVMINYLPNSEFGSIMQKVSRAYEDTQSAFRVYAQINPDTIIKAKVMNIEDGEDSTASLKVSVQNPESIANALKGESGADGSEPAMPVRVVGLKSEIENTIKSMITSAINDSDKDDISLTSIMTSPDGIVSEASSANGATKLNADNIENTLLYRIILTALGYFSSSVDEHALNVVNGAGNVDTDVWENAGVWNKWQYIKPQ